jgi:hypothetical protein
LNYRYNLPGRQEKSEQKKIVGLKIYDQYDGKRNFTIEFTISEFKEFAIKISDLAK